MSYLADWKALSTRIQGMLQAGLLHSQLLAVKSSDDYSGGLYLLEQTTSIFNTLKIFANQYSDSLPQLSRETLQQFIQKNTDLFAMLGGTSGAQFERLKATMVKLIAFEAEFSFVLADTQEVKRRRSELAFAHLQRCIVADVTTKDKWQRAFKEGELACEKLGASHLLLHGIWAFKVDAAGARTDLIFPEPLDLVAIERSAEGLVLTEWKLARETNDAPKQFDNARKQAARYASGPLAGVELRNYRFAVVVTERLVDPPNDVINGDLIYRHINLAVNPQTPSHK